MATTRRKGKTLDIPDHEEDPGERKRVLNVLAQRRYRKRKREHLRALEKSANHGSTQETPCREPQHSTVTEQPMMPPEVSFDQCYEQEYLAGYVGEPNFSADLVSIQPNFEQPACFDPSSLDAFDASFNFPLPSLPTSPSLTTQTTRSPRAMSRSPQPQSTWFEQSLDFPDENYLPILELNLLRGSMIIAKRLEVDSLIWSPEANSLFHNAKSLTYTHLPVNLRPSPVQLRNPHHPALDVLPWPSVRDKLILVFSQPPEMRPPSARSPTALFDFIYDLEDSAEGVRIWGDDPCAEENWEVGEKLFQNWWWALDRHVLNRSNELRRNRGANILGTDRIRDIQEIE